VDVPVPPPLEWALPTVSPGWWRERTLRALVPNSPRIYLHPGPTALDCELARREDKSDAETTRQRARGGRLCNPRSSRAATEGSRETGIAGWDTPPTRRLCLADLISRARWAEFRQLCAMLGVRPQFVLSGLLFFMFIRPHPYTCLGIEW
jgi:hypothetical protein